MEQPVSRAAAPSSFGEKLFEANCKASLLPQQSAIDSLAEVWTHGIIVKPSFGNSVFAPYIESAKIEVSNYRASLTTSSGANIMLSQFGIKYDHFAKVLIESWGDALAKALLMEEPQVVYEASCYYSMQQPSQQPPTPCRARIYETALVVLPSNSAPIRIPFSRIQALNSEGYRVVLLMPEGGSIEFSRLGNTTQFFVEKLREAMKKVEAASIETIRTIIPYTTFEELQRLSVLMIEGRAACRKDVQTISADLWAKLEKCVALSPVAETYQYLSWLAETSLEAVGLRKTMNAVYVWFMMPLIGSANSGGNAVALEVTSETGRATYLFRIMSRREFPTATHDRFVQEAAKVIRDLNEAIIATGFRREPIYLSEDQLNTPEYSKYLYAANHLESLRLLRERFFARIIHNTFDQWKIDLGDALLFNTASDQDNARWSKDKLDFIESSQLQPSELSKTQEASDAKSYGGTMIGEKDVAQKKRYKP